MSSPPPFRTTGVAHRRGGMIHRGQAPDTPGGVGLPPPVGWHNPMTPAPPGQLHPSKPRSAEPAAPPPDAPGAGESAPSGLFAVDARTDAVWALRVGGGADAQSGRHRLA
ncbi:hypothetical protein GCM10009753_61610 [Streptantibioticus ferralitis]